MFFPENPKGYGLPLFLQLLIYNAAHHNVHHSESYDMTRCNYSMPLVDWELGTWRFYRYNWLPDYNMEARGYALDRIYAFQKTVNGQYWQSRPKIPEVRSDLDMVHKVHEILTQDEHFGMSFTNALDYEAAKRMLPKVGDYNDDSFLAQGVSSSDNLSNV